MPWDRQYYSFCIGTNTLHTSCHGTPTPICGLGTIRRQRVGCSSTVRQICIRVCTDPAQTPTAKYMWIRDQGRSTKTTQLSHEPGALHAVDSVSEGRQHSWMRIDDMALQRTRQVRKGLLKEETVQSMVNGTRIHLADSCPMPIMGRMHTKNGQGYRGRLSYSCGVTCLARRP